MNRQQDRDPVTDASDNHYLLVAALIVVALVVALVAAKLLGWA
jgi:hypothetical protein